MSQASITKENHSRRNHPITPPLIQSKHVPVKHGCHTRKCLSSGYGAFTAHQDREGSGREQPGRAVVDAMLVLMVLQVAAMGTWTYDGQDTAAGAVATVGADVAEVGDAEGLRRG
ncbi:hypothetical protein RRF57_002581 [Xylaria bambusicola]|uniref:Uncharacterized protein n=1 Tax=Xylaria bambusicola TaxID=326684 RepID=A0AAN7UIX6_9PEZI